MGLVGSLVVGVFGREAFVVGASVVALVVEEEVLRALERVVIALRALALSRNDGLSLLPDDKVGRNLKTEGIVTPGFSSVSGLLTLVVVGLKRANGAVVVVFSGSTSLALVTMSVITVGSPRARLFSKTSSTS